MSILGNYSVFKRRAPKQVDVQEGTIIQVFHSWMRKRIFGKNERETKITDMEVTWLYSAYCQAANQPHSSYDQPVVL
jgi:hypothetical protein